jgi:two-component system response regulator DegU
MDINMPGVNGIDATRKILSVAANTKILALSIHSDKRFVMEMLDAGAVGYLLKDDAPEELVKAIEITNKGDMFLSPRITRVALSKNDDEGKTKEQGISEVSGIEIEADQKERLNLLTSKEMEILKCISRGLQNKEIADQLFNSELTIKKHISNMLNKMKVRNRLSLVTKAREIGIILDNNF